VISGVELFNDAGMRKSTWPGKFRILTDMKEIGDFCLQQYMGPSVGGPYAKLFRSDIIHEHSLRFPDNVWYGEDNAFNFNTYRLSKTVVLIPGILYQYRMRGGSACTQIGSDMIAEWVQNRKLREDFFVLCGVENAIQKTNALYMRTLITKLKQYCQAPDIGNVQKRTFVIQTCSLPATRSAVENMDYGYDKRMGFWLASFLIRIRSYLPLYWLYLIKAHTMKRGTL
jgi:hypothetical protein